MPLAVFCPASLSKTARHMAHCASTGSTIIKNTIIKNNFRFILNASLSFGHLSKGEKWLVSIIINSKVKSLHKLLLQKLQHTTILEMLF